MDKDYSTVLLEDNKGRVTIPAPVRKQIAIDERIVYRMIYKQAGNEIILLPIGKSELK